MHRNTNDYAEGRILQSAYRACFFLAVCACIALCFALSAAHAGQKAPSDPRAAATRFYHTYLRLKIIGLPNAGQMRALFPLLSPEVRREFATAQRVQEKAIKAHPGDKPPYADGDLFSSLFEGARSFRVGHPRMRAGFAEVPVMLERKERGPATRWTDTLVLKRSAGAWRVWDIKFGGKWQFKSGTSLRDNLKAE